jgi:hypothetical protein
MSYFFKSTNINQIIEPGSINVGGNEFIGFPNSVSTNFPILRPLSFGFKRNNVDISTYCTAKSTMYYDTFSTSGFTTKYSINITSPANAKYISTICIGPGGGGGGGGGGGSGDVGSGTGPGGREQNRGSDGGIGGHGAYSAIGVYPINSMSKITIKVGLGGVGGLRGNDSNGGGAGNEGGQGSLGNESSVEVDDVIICRAPSGNAGMGGGGGDRNGDDTNTAGIGNVGIGTFASGGAYTTAYYNSMNHPYLGYKSEYGQGGTGGSGSNDDGTAGGKGQDGCVQIIFLYE